MAAYTMCIRRVEGAALYLVSTASKWRAQRRVLYQLMGEQQPSQEKEQYDSIL